MQLITAPSKTQQFNNRKFATFTLPDTLSTSEKIIGTLKKQTKEEIASLMKTSEKLTHSTYERIHAFTLPFNRNNATQALFTFQGDAYDAITASTYSEEELHHAQAHLNILSGLYGILRPLDLMQPYRLEMAAKLEVAGNKNLYSLWKEEVTGLLNSRLKESTEPVVINLASEEYSKAIDRKTLEAKMITIIFKQEHKGKIKTIPIHSKRARGMMIHFMIINRLYRSEELKAFDLDGYSLMESETTESSWVFLKR